MKKRIYLAGSSESADWANAYRQEAASYLPEWDTIDPFKGRTIDGKCALYSPKEVVLRDLKFIDSADALLAEMLLDDYNYIGTSMEIFYASQVRHIPVVVCTQKYQRHYWLRDLAVGVFPDLKECCDYVNAFWG